jgi:cyclopropane fatty-acyl-phospholipid synthase-like methyltransferase
MSPVGGSESARWRKLVREGYDAISHSYRDDDGRSNPTTGEEVERYRDWVIELTGILKPGSQVLDLGCGAGVPATRLLVEAGYEVLGLDFSTVQIARARSLVPGADFVEADMATWDTEPESFDAVVSFYALIHVPLEDQQLLLPRIRRWLRPHGVFLGIVGLDHWRGVEEYLGAPMFWEHADTQTYLDWLAGSGLQPLWHRFVPEGAVGHTLVLARAV